jgi:hypothetical protein
MYSFFVCSVFSLLFSGQGTANFLAEVFSFPEDSETEEDLVEEDSPCEDSDDTLLQFLISAGLLYTHSGESRWSVFISQSVTSSVDANDPVKNGVRWFPSHHLRIFLCNFVQRNISQNKMKVNVYLLLK